MKLAIFCPLTILICGAVSWSLYNCNIYVGLIACPISVYLCYKWLIKPELNDGKVPKDNVKEGKK